LIPFIPTAIVVINLLSVSGSEHPMAQNIPANHLVEAITVNAACDLNGGAEQDNDRSLKRWQHALYTT